MSQPATDPLSFAENLDLQLQEEGEATCLVLIQGDGQARQVTRTELRSDIHASARILQANGINAGDLVVLVFNHCYELIPAVLGSIHLGAVPLILPYLDIISAYALEKQIEVSVNEWGARAIITSPDFLKKLDFLGSFPGQVIAMPAPGAGLGDGAFIKANQRSGAETIHLQLSSGTTGEPKVVRVSHSSFMSGIRGMIQGLQLTSQDVSVGWLPLHHDLGLYFQIFMPLLNGMLSVIIMPTYWVQRPRSLLQAVHRYRGTYTGMPNFAFNHSVRSIRQSDLAGLDLSCWRLVLNGAELIHSESIEMFYKTFAPCGLRHEAMRTIYGMSENSCTITLSPEVAKGQAWRVDWVAASELADSGAARPLHLDDPAGRAVVSCGFPLPHTEIQIVSQDGAVQPDRGVGEILLRTPFLAPEYFRPEHGAIAGEDGWFPTGDLGYLVNGELFICGRKKDVIVSAGNKIFPGTIELVGLKVLGKKAGDVAAFGVTNQELGTEFPVLICEIRGQSDTAEHEGWSGEIRQLVRQQTGVLLADIRFVRRGWLVQTTSAKVNRSACRQKYLAEYSLPVGNLDHLIQHTRSPRPSLPVPFIAPHNNIQTQLAQIYSDILGLAEIGVEDNFFDLGGDSLSALSLSLQIQARFQLTLPLEYFTNPTIASLEQLLVAGSPSSSLPASQAFSSHRTHHHRRQSKSSGVEEEKEPVSAPGRIAHLVSRVVSGSMNKGYHMAHAVGKGPLFYTASARLIYASFGPNFQTRRSQELNHTFRLFLEQNLPGIPAKAVVQHKRMLHWWKNAWGENWDCFPRRTFCPSAR